MTRPASRRRPAGFSLLELTIVIGIILLLAALVLAVSTSVIAANEKRKTRNTLAVLDAAMKEWERQVDRPVTFQNAANETGTWEIPFNPTVAQLQIPANAQPYNSDVNARRTAALLDLVSKQPDVEAILARLPEDTFRRIRAAGTTVVFSNVGKEALDAWGNPIRAVFPGRAFRPGDPGVADLDGTIRSASENDMGIVCRNRQVLFVSAGPDGIVRDIPTTAAIDESADNLFSYGQEGQP